MSGAVPYKRTPVFDQDTLPAGLRRAHATKPGIWGVVRVIEGKLRLRFDADGSGDLLDADHPGLLPPERLHQVEPVGLMKMQVEFYQEQPALGSIYTPSSGMEAA